MWAALSDFFPLIDHRAEVDLSEIPPFDGPYAPNHDNPSTQQPFTRCSSFFFLLIQHIFLPFRIPRLFVAGKVHVASVKVAKVH